MLLPHTPVSRTDTYCVLSPRAAAQRERHLNHSPSFSNMNAGGAAASFQQNQHDHDYLPPHTTTQISPNAAEYHPRAAPAPPTMIPLFPNSSSLGGASSTTAAPAAQQHSISPSRYKRRPSFDHPSPRRGRTGAATSSGVVHAGAVGARAESSNRSLSPYAAQPGFLQKPLSRRTASPRNPSAERKVESDVDARLNALQHFLRTNKT